MKHFVYLASILAFAPLAAQAQIKQQDTSLKPVGENLELRTTLVLDSVQVRSNRQQVFTPVVEGKNGQTAVFKSLIVNGRRQHIYYLRNGNKRYPDAYEVERENGKQQYEYTASIPYEEWMDGAVFRINTDTCGCGNLLGQNPGTPQTLDFHPETGLCFDFVEPDFTMNPDADDPIVSISGRAFLDYPVNRTELYPDYRQNPRELAKIIATIDTVRNNDKVSITGIDIHGYASPEGPWDNNIRLSKGRAATLKDYVRQLYRFDDRIFTVKNTPEDWEGLDSLLRNSNIDHKEEILRIVRDESIAPDPRNEKIKQLYPEQYRFIHASWYPALRHSDYTVYYKIRPMSDAEAAELLHTNPELLSLRKMHRIAKLYKPGSEEFNEVFRIAVRMYPKDPLANLNAATLALQERRLTEADVYLKRAGNSPQAVHARGVLRLLQGDFDEAQKYLEEAQKQGIEQAEKNLEILQRMRLMK